MSLDLDCRPPIFIPLLTLPLGWFMSEKYEIIKNYVSRFSALDVHLLPSRNQQCLVFASAQHLLVCFKAPVTELGRLFVFHHVHRVYLISVSLFCLFNVAFSGMVCVSALTVRHRRSSRVLRGQGNARYHLPPIVNWPKIFPRTGGEWKVCTANKCKSFVGACVDSSVFLFLTVCLKIKIQVWMPLNFEKLLNFLTGQIWNIFWTG